MLIKCSTKGDNWLAILMLSLVLERTIGRLATETIRPPHAKWCVVTHLLLTTGSRVGHLVSRHCFVSHVLKISS